MRITEHRPHDIVVLELKGRLTIDDGLDQLRDTVNRAISKSQPKIVLNLSGVPHIDSPSLGELVRCLTATRQAGGSVKLFGLSGRVVELLTITKLITEFDTFDSEDEALSSFMTAV
ncbi:MAG TPA: STAS domain-containing protein [Vicinamibacterales bacterium]|nr:STAS domain-containing protein [Vicinamibacterales bacterium]